MTPNWTRLSHLIIMIILISYHILNTYYVPGTMLSLFFFLKFLNFYFIYKELVLFLRKVDVPDDPFKEVHLVRLNEASVFCVPVEKLAAHIEAIFPEQSLSRHGKSKNPGQIFSDGSSRAAGDPCCSLSCNEEKC